MRLLHELLALPDIRGLQAAPPMEGEITPFSAEKGDVRLAKEALLQGKVGTILLAGGQGSRFSRTGLPKALVEVGGKTLLQWFLHRVKRAREQYRARLPVAIMVSPMNCDSIAAHVDLEDVILFTQTTYPVWAGGRLQLAAPDRLAVAPAGNGMIFQDFPSQRWPDIAYWTTVVVDNPLADPFSLDLLAVHLCTQSDMSGIAITPRSVEEKVGLFVLREGKPAVVEYSEKGAVTSSLANTSLFCFSTSLMRTVPLLPLHAVQRKMVVFDGGYVEREVVKYERFIFDAMAHARRFSAVHLPRERCFAPLKNSTGDDSIATVAAALECLQ